MTLPGALTATFHITVKSGHDSYNNDTVTVTDLAIDGCVFAPGGSTEILTGRDTVVTQPTLYCPAVAATVKATDSVTVPGYGDFEVDGVAAVWPASPFTGWSPGRNVVVRLREVTG